MDRPEQILPALEKARAEVARLERELAQAKNQTTYVRENMKSSGEYERRIQRYIKGFENYLKEKERYGITEDKRVLIEFFLIGGGIVAVVVGFIIGILPTVFIFLLSGGFGVRNPLFVPGLIAIGGGVGLCGLGCLLLRFVPELEKPELPEPEEFGLIGAKVYLIEDIRKQDWRTPEEERANYHYDLAWSKWNSAKKDLERLEEAYRVALMPPSEQAAYWAKKQYELMKEECEIIEDELGAMAFQAQQAAEREAELLAEQTRLLRERAEEERKLLEEQVRLARKTAEEVEELRRKLEQGY